MHNITTTIKSLAPEKLTGVAFQDAPTIPRFAAHHMTTVPNLDFWGLNVYRTTTIGLEQLFYLNDNTNLGYALLPGKALKPVIFTEMGWPQTTHPSADCSGLLQIHDNDLNVTNGVANIFNVLGGEIILKRKYPLCPGIFYFEFSDEWWKHGPAGCLDPREISCTWAGSPGDGSGFPGKWWDERGFGIFSIRRNPMLNNCSDDIVFYPEANYFGPNPNFDLLELGRSQPNARTPLYTTLVGVYGGTPSFVPPTQIDANSISVFPNPAHGFVTLILPDLGIPSQIEIVKLNGEVVKSLSTTEATVTIPLNNVQPGLYHVSISINGVKVRKQLILQ